MLIDTPNHRRDEKLRRSLEDRIEENLRWIDQKVTYDNLFHVASLIDVKYGQNNQEFSRIDLQYSAEFEQVMTQEYGKPSPMLKETGNEYDKFLQQNLLVLVNAGILDVRFVGRRYLFSIANRELLQTISSTPAEARTFLIAYIEEYLRIRSGWKYFERYFESEQTADDFFELKEKFTSWMVMISKAGSRGSKNPEVEIRRIFTKVMNQLCFKYLALGSSKGHQMKTIPSTYDLIYNKPNFRDQNSKKPRNLTRQQFELEASTVFKHSQKNLTAAMKAVKNYHNSQPEIATHGATHCVHVHHIFPKSEFPDLSEIKENLIVLTPTQHYAEAHPVGNTSRVDPGYQRICLFEKLVSVRESVQKEDGMYSYENFAKVIRLGYQMESVEPSYISLKDALISLEDFV